MKGIRILDGSIIWENGSRTYPPALLKAADPAGRWPYPPPGGGTPVEVAEETPAQGGGQAPAPITPGVTPTVNPGPFPPTVSTTPPVATVSTPPEIVALPPSPTPADIWDRWQQLVAHWQCLISWGGGDLDKLTAAIGDMPLWTTNKGAKTAIGWWKDIQAAGYDKAATVDDLKKGLGVYEPDDIARLLNQYNDLAARARVKGYPGCAPHAESPLATAHAAAHTWWSGLSTGGKVIAGGAALGALALIVRGAAK